MARRDEGVLDLLVELPWWIGAIVAALVYVGMKFVVPILVGTEGFGPVIRDLSVMFAPWFALTCLVAAGISALREFVAKRRRVSEAKMRAAQGIGVCPSCGSQLVLRTASKGANRGGQFWGCSAYPKCHYTKDLAG